MTRPTEGNPSRAGGGRSRRAGSVSTRTRGGEPLVASWDPSVDPDQRIDELRRQGPRRRGRLRRALDTYGWRVYAVPVLIVLTVLALYDATSDSSDGGGDGGETHNHVAGGGEGPLVPNPDASVGYDRAKASAELPGGGPFTEAGAGTWTVVPGAGPQIGTGRLLRYTVEIEDGVAVTGGPEGFAATVDATLADPRSWVGSSQYAFQRIDDSAAADLRISLTSQQTTRSTCGFSIPFDSSCWKGDQKRVTVNNARWARGAVPFEGNLVLYQQYVVNHEVGHALGFQHVPCDVHDRLAPVMMQQSWGVSNDYLAALGTDNSKADGRVCRPNAWPYPAVN